MIKTKKVSMTTMMKAELTAMETIVMVMEREENSNKASDDDNKDKVKKTKAARIATKDREGKEDVYNNEQRRLLQ